MPNEDQIRQMTSGLGFIAALDQSGGSTPKALSLYGIPEDRYSSEEEMFDLVHEMRSRIVRSPAFSGDKVIGAILFEKTMERDFAGVPAAQYLWEKKGVVPFLKIDKGLEPEDDGVRLMKPNPGLDALLDRAVAHGIFGTKERSVIDAASPSGIRAVVDQQFEVARRVLDKGLVPIIEPEVTITIEDKADAERLLLEALHTHLDALPDGSKVMLKLSLPSMANFYAPLIVHDRVMRVVALSGGYTREEACKLLAQNTGMIASFSRALTEGLTADQDDDAFDRTLEEAIDAIYAASIAG
ncbi:fructose bisphosphate aldolase [Rhodosalinus halophilus]|uniref:fructose-bisphosphate aldolase n=1 Tax=Rhodosalinus halophilus TaxID=2259333 RepID=A0A365UEF6_9RHOB|nr:fructose bisphosphate aldolase [Rhodosalinus halophilus]RBI87667.1 fructose bisphosphate aldolase [Rhodosalinus halophilus]